MAWGKAHAEVLLEGPAGTGKSRGVLQYVDALCEMFPGIRVLICRQTLKSLRESVQVTLEEKVWWEGHPCLTASDASRDHRSSYTYPKATNKVGGVTYSGESHIVLGGLDNPDKTFSTEYDVVLVEEGIETNLDAWMKLRRVNRNYRMPWQQQIASTNPGSEFHYLNLRPEERDEETGEKIMHRLLSRHRDNPMLWDVGANDWTEAGHQYVHKALGHMRGAVRERLLNGRWVSEEGQVWEDFDSAVHLLDCELAFTDQGTWTLNLPAAQAKRSRLPATVHLRWFFASMDFGFNPDPGVVQVWGVDSEGRMFRVQEVYRRNETAEWWAGIVREIHAEFKLRRIICDPSGKERIESLNYFLRHPGEALSTDPMSRIAVKGINEIKAGVDMVAWALRPGMAEDVHSDDPAEYGPPRLFFCRSAFDKYGMDKKLLAERRPACTEQEIPSYTWPKHEDGKARKDKPDPACEDHGCDALRYAVMFGFNKNLAPTEQVPEIKPGTMADLMGHSKVGRKNRPRRW